MKPVAFAYWAEYPKWDPSETWDHGRLSRIDLSPVTILFGRTGAGKTSMLRGVAAVLHDNNRSANWASGLDDFSQDGYIVYEAESEHEHIAVREFATDVVEIYCGMLEDNPSLYFHDEYADPVPWYERTADHDMQTKEELESGYEAWRQFREDQEIWRLKIRKALLDGLELELKPHAELVLDVILKRPLIGQSKMGKTVWLCDSEDIGPKTWLAMEACASSDSRTAIPVIASLLLEQRGSAFLALHEIDPDMAIRAGSVSGVIPSSAMYGSLHASSSEVNLEWFIARRINEIGLTENHLEVLPAAVRTHLPPFVKRLGEFALRFVASGSFSHFQVGVVAPNGFIPYRKLSSGARSWIALAVSLAFSELHHAISNPGTGVGRQDEPEKMKLFYLLDEPESHLDPLTQLETLRWLESQASDSRIFVLATHSDVFLNEAGPTARIYGLRRSHQLPEALSLDSNLLAMVERHASELGLGRAAILQTARILLLVEGKHDVEVIQTMFRAELTSARVLLLALGGTSNAKNALTEGRFFHQLGTRLMLLFDNVRASKFSQQRLPKQSSREEERIAAVIIDTLRKDGVNVQLLPFDKPDIICAIPEATVNRAYPGASCDWGDLIKDFRHGNSGGFKEFAFRAMGLTDVRASEFVTACLAVWTVEDGRDPQLSSVFERLASTSVEITEPN